VTERHEAGSERERNEAASRAQREGARKLSLEERFRQNDSISRLRAQALKSPSR
jgi:hypothetical protein